MPCSCQVVAFDFKTREHHDADVGQIPAILDEGRFVWIDVEFDDQDAARERLRSLGLIGEEIIEDAVCNEPSTQHARYPEYLHLVVSGCRMRGDQFDLERVDAIMGQRFLLTIHRGPVVFLSAVRRDYPDDFKRYAMSPSFLVYELWDHLVDNYLGVQKKMEHRVESLQTKLIGDVDTRVFSAVSELGADLLHFRKILLPARSVLSDLATKKSIFISEATQPYLANMVGTLEHVLQDLLVDRDILSESLNLYMSMVSYRTNEVMKRLTVVSVVFLPLTFLCGVYGMNFEVLPELHWNFGYAYFWSLVVVVSLGLFVLLRRARMI